MKKACSPIGALVVLADHALGHRLSDSLAPDERMVTSHMHIELVRPPQPRVNHFVGESQEVHRVPGSGFSRGHIRNPAGELVALISARFALFPAEDTQGGAVHDFTPQADDLPEAPGPTSGLAIAPIHRLLGTRLRTESRGRVEVDFVAAPELATSNRAYTVGSAR